MFVSSKGLSSHSGKGMIGSDPHNHRKEVQLWDRTSDPIPPHQILSRSQAPPAPAPTAEKAHRGGSVPRAAPMASPIS